MKQTHGGAREGAGRPPLPKRAKASERLAVRLTLSEKRRLEAYCRERKITEADAVRSWIASL